MRNIILAAITMAAICSCKKTNETPVVGRAVTQTSSKWISRIIEYRPAPGQFINQDLGSQKGAQSIVGKLGLVSLGGFGGYIVFTFDHTVLNGAGTDFVIHGNAFQGSSEAGGVEVSFDTNSNGLADDTWYRIDAPADVQAKQATITYTRPAQTTQAADVNWVLSDGQTGKLDSESIKTFHSQCYYPLFLADNPSSLSFTGKILASNAKLNPQTGFWEFETIDSNGYADNFSDDYMGIVANDNETQRSNKFDIAMAVDTKGNPVKLDGVDFIKVYTCINAQGGGVGECSTEVCGAISLSVPTK